MAKRASVKELRELARQIKDKALRKKVVDLFRDPSMSHRDLAKRFPPSDLATAPGSIQFHHTYERGLVEHTVAVTRLCIGVANTLNDTYGMGLDLDALIAGALVHDIGKLWGMQKTKAGWQPTGLTLDHTIAGTSELYSRGFPEKVLHIVASHFGEKGPTPPQTPEALIFHTIDNMNATLRTATPESVLGMLFGQG